MNKAFFIGNLTRDPELSQTPSGVSVCKFGLAVNRNFTNANGEREVDFFNIVAWRALGENCAKYLSKGKKVSIVGRVEITKYEDKQGEEKTVVNVVAEDVEFLSPRSDDEAENAPQKPSGKKKTVVELQPIAGEDLPF